jgi:hypothetical protein
MTLVAGLCTNDRTQYCSHPEQLQIRSECTASCVQPGSTTPDSEAGCEVCSVHRG